MPSRVNGTTPTLVAAAPSPCGPWRVSPGTAASRVSASAVSCCSWAAMRSSPTSASRATAAARATAPTTLGVPPSSRSGRSAHSTSSTVTACTVPPPGWCGRLSNASRRPDQGTGAERGVHLVGGEGDEVEVPRIVVGAHVDRAVGGELGGVDQDAPAGRVHPLGQGVDRRHDAGDVGGAGDGQQRDPPRVAGEQPVQVVLVEGPVRSRAHVDDRGPSPPRQVVGVVLERRREHDRARSGIVSDRAARLSASVVFRPNTTTSRSGSAPTNAPTASRARS